MRVSFMKIREYRFDTDYEAILKLSERLADFELPVRIKQEVLSQKQREWLVADLEKQSENSQLLVVEDDNCSVQGFLELLEEIDWLTDQKQAYVSRVCLAREIEGFGYGKRLMQLAEDWAITQGYAGITLLVVATNQRAAAFYRSLGYEIETMKLRKALD